MNEKWEYKTIKLDKSGREHQKELGPLGLECWEAVGISVGFSGDSIVLLKRQIVLR